MGFRDQILAGSRLIREAMESVPFVSGSEGWRIARDGSAEFLNLIMRGEVRIDGPTGFLRLYNYTDGIERPTVFFEYNDGINPVSDGYIWYDQVTAAGRGRMRIHVESPTAGNDVDLFLVGGNTVTDEGYVRVTKRVRHSDPSVTGLAEDWHNFSYNAALVPPWVSAVGFGVRYMLLPDGFVAMEGRATGGNTAVGSLVGTLPVGYRPFTGPKRFESPTSGTSASALLQVATDGTIVIARTPAVAALHFDMVHFSTF